VGRWWPDARIIVVGVKEVRDQVDWQFWKAEQMWKRYVQGKRRRASYTESLATDSRVMSCLVLEISADLSGSGKAQQIAKEILLQGYVFFKERRSQIIHSRSKSFS
jgi:hypothetical protein